MELQEIRTDIGNLKTTWVTRNQRFREWFDLLNLVDKLKQEGLESVCSNDPRTMFNLAHYLMTAGDTHHIIPISTDAPMELEKQARVERALEYLWKKADRKQMLGGGQRIISELNFNILGFGWYCGVAGYDETEQEGKVVLWSPADTYPRYADGQLITCLHEYKLPINVAKRKANANGWTYNPIRSTGDVVLSDYYYVDENDNLMNTVLIDNEIVMKEIKRDDVLLLVSPVGGFADRGSIIPGDIQWTTRLGQSILETNRDIYNKINRWLTFELQILRDTAQPTYIEESQGDPKVRPEQLTERGTLLHYNIGEGLHVLDPAPMPLEIQAAIASFDKQSQKGGFGDTLYGLLEGNLSGFALSQAIETANRVLYNYQEAKNFFVSEVDRFWLLKMKETSKSFQIKGRMIEEVSPKDIPEDTDIIVESELATPRDWLEKATVANYLRDLVDDTTILSDVLKVKDTNGVQRRRDFDRLEQHPQIMNAKLIAYCNRYADYLEYVGDREQAMVFRQAAAGVMQQMGGASTGEPPSPRANEVLSARKAGAPEESPAPVAPSVQPPTMRRIAPEVQKGE
jgi:hypothetical protein